MFLLKIKKKTKQKTKKQTKNSKFVFDLKDLVAGILRVSQLIRIS